MGIALRPSLLPATSAIFLNLPTQNRRHFEGNLTLRRAVVVVAHRSNSNLAEI
jgi:hypothetical protein